MISLFRALVALLLLVVSTLVGMPALANPVSVTFCASYQIDYVDSDNGTDDFYYGDYFETNSNKVARGARVQVWIGSNLQEEHHAAWDGTDAGCAGPFSLNTAVLYSVKILSDAEVNGNTIKVWDDEDTPALYASTVLSAWSPGSSGTVNITTANTHDAWNVAAAAGHAMYRRAGGLSNKTFDFFVEVDVCTLGETECERCPGASCEVGGDLHMNGSSTTKAVIVHELGHAMLYFASGGAEAPKSYGAATDNCYSDASRNHEMNSKEFQSAAIKEGLSHTYAAVAFNLTTELDCGYPYYKSQDFDLDLNRESDEYEGFSCETGEHVDCVGCIDSRDYLGDWCTGTLTNRSTEMDWLRFWWDEFSEQGVTMADALEITAGAWTGDYTSPSLGNWDGSPGSGTPNEDRPGVRMEASADALGLGTEWDAEKSNGIDE